MKAIVARLAQEVINQVSEVSLTAERLPPGTIVAFIAAHLQEAKESVQRALETLKMKLEIEPGKKDNHTRHMA